MERNFLLDEGSQWTWHKSWNLPNISITLDVSVQVVNYLSRSKIKSQVKLCFHHKTFTYEILFLDNSSLGKNLCSEKRIRRLRTID